ncbi:MULTISPECIES: SDR family oxidoreductase [unclassified Streptomyces]|uniref:SDR family oxidoreductase n=1 Tax=unclassified Streptomyces TaxID=2593676 RepID=UPI00110F9AA4|nr:NAD(P)-dependent oxidoreductase [Streptomyces sp. DASNCL29]TMU98154.1 NAD(P)-dependent oxidoreductase [Streptomyces sp. DASNCL29]
MTKSSLAGKTVLVSGGSRGIGLAIALRAAQDGANLALLAKTAEPHPKLDGTVFTAAEEVEAAGGRALPIVGDVRVDADVEGAIAKTVEAFGGIDAVINNASAIDLSPTSRISMKRYDLMQDINTRGTFALSRAALPYLEKAANPHILTLSPPLNLDPRWAGAHLAYTLSKYGMSLCTLGLSAELANQGVAANSLWPRTTIATAAVHNLLGGTAATQRSRTPQIMADAAYAILTRDSLTCTGNLFTDEEVLVSEGITDLSGYRLSDREEDLDLDFFLPESPLP